MLYIISVKVRRDYVAAVVWGISAIGWVACFSCLCHEDICTQRSSRDEPRRRTYSVISSRRSERVQASSSSGQSWQYPCITSDAPQCIPKNKIKKLHRFSIRPISAALLARLGGEAAGGGYSWCSVNAARLMRIAVCGCSSSTSAPPPI